MCYGEHDTWQGAPCKLREKCIMKKNLYVQVAALAGILLGISNAWAASTTFAGDACMPMPLTSSNYGIWYNSADNTSSAAELTVNCMTPRFGTRISSASVQVYDRNTTVDVSCTLYDQYVNSSGLYFYSASAASSGYGSGPQTLSFGALSYAGGGLDFYSLQCTIPRVESGYSHILKYTINES